MNLADYFPQDSCAALANHILERLVDGNILRYGTEKGLYFIPKDLAIRFNEQSERKIQAVARLVSWIIQEQLGPQGRDFEGSYTKNGRVQCCFKHFDTSKLDIKTARLTINAYMRSLREGTDPTLTTHVAKLQKSDQYWLGPFTKEQLGIILPISGCLFSYHNINLDPPPEVYRERAGSYIVYERSKMKELLAKEPAITSKSGQWI